MTDVIALGELLVDFTQDDAGRFEANPGGAPCNVLAMLARLGHRTAFIGKVGEDAFGAMLKSAIERAGIDAGGLVRDPGAHTTLAFVHNGAEGERSFTFYRNPGADELLRSEEIPVDRLSQTKIFHFGSLSLTHPSSRSATQSAVNAAHGACISFDPNLRPALWDDLAQAKEQMLWGCSVCDILKISDEEAVFLTGEAEASAGAMRLRREFPNIRLLLLTCGKKGSSAFWEDKIVTQRAYCVNAVDTTGAGDIFFGCCLHNVLRFGFPALGGHLKEMLRFSNAAAALITERKGVIERVPDEREIYDTMEHTPLL